MIELNYDAIIDETEKAWFIQFGEEVSKWIPKSQCEKPDRTISVKKSLVEEEELEYYVI